MSDNKEDKDIFEDPESLLALQLLFEKGYSTTEITEAWYALEKYLIERQNER